jgi:hypothetical protein
MSSAGAKSTTNKGTAQSMFLIHCGTASGTGNTTSNSTWVLHQLHCNRALHEPLKNTRREDRGSCMT